MMIYKRTLWLLLTYFLSLDSFQASNTFDYADFFPFQEKYVNTIVQYWRDGDMMPKDLVTLVTKYAKPSVLEKKLIYKNPKKVGSITLTTNPLYKDCVNTPKVSPPDLSKKCPFYNSYAFSQGMLEICHYFYKNDDVKVFFHVVHGEEWINYFVQHTSKVESFKKKNKEVSMLCAYSNFVLYAPLHNIFSDIISIEVSLKHHKLSWEVHLEENDPKLKYLSLSNVDTYNSIGLKNLSDKCISTKKTTDTSNMLNNTLFILVCIVNNKVKVI